MQQIVTYIFLFISLELSAQAERNSLYIHLATHEIHDSTLSKNLKQLNGAELESELLDSLFRTLLNNTKKLKPAEKTLNKRNSENQIVPNQSPLLILSLVDSSMYNNWSIETKNEHYNNTLIAVSKTDSKQNAQYSIIYCQQYNYAQIT